MGKDTKRGERLHHDARVKAKWRRRIRECWYGGGFEDPQKQAEWEQRTVTRRAHHNKCPCGLCKRERYDRAKAKCSEVKESRCECASGIGGSCARRWASAA